MNRTSEKMLEILKELRDEYGVIAVKAEFEAEGSRTDELVMLNEVVFRADMKLFIKIGGCEAVRDLDQCRILGASGIMAPMIETPFAMKKYVEAGKKVYGDRLHDIEWIINTETAVCHQNLDKILQQGEGFLNTISIGRVDLSASMNLSREEINSSQVFAVTSDLAKRAKEKGLLVGFGGGISIDAVPFIVDMSTIADKFETRKIVFSIDDSEERLKRGIIRAMEFEQLYLQNKCEFYDRMANEDKDRLRMMVQRIEAAWADIGQY